MTNNKSFFDNRDLEAPLPADPDDCVIRLAEHRGPHGGTQVFMLCDLRSEDRTTYLYRRYGAWLETAGHLVEDAWFFAGEEGDMPPCYWYGDSKDETVPAELVPESIIWYDAYERGESTEICATAFVGSDPEMLVRRLPGRAHFSIELLVNDVLWQKSADESWTFFKNLSVRDRVQLEALQVMATHILETAFLAREQDGPDMDIDVAEAHALALGAYLPVIPTFEQKLLELYKQGPLLWKDISPLVSLQTASEFLIDGHDRVFGLVVNQAHKSWLRLYGTWTQVDPARIAKKNFKTHKVSIRNLRNAVNWWDICNRPEIFAHELPVLLNDRLQFVTNTDPYESRNFPLIQLVRGSLNDGDGWIRQGYNWHRTQIPVLDVENHMPADEGDMRPWGGEYLYCVPEALEPLALSFWDKGQHDYLVGNRHPSWNDFLDWLKTRS
ncbi:hypothetical protein ACWF5H_09360 [Arthrobacter sp. NPDC055138]